MSNLELYEWMPKVYHHLMFAMVLFSCGKILHTNNFRIIHFFSPRPEKPEVFFLLLVTIFFIGFLPVPWKVGGDRAVYAELFNTLQSRSQLDIHNDFLFYTVAELFSLFSTYTFFFVFVAGIYCYSRYHFAKKMVPQYTYLMLLMFFSSFAFYAYGTNTLRAGLAISFLLTATSYWKKEVFFYPLLIIAWFIHGSVIIPIVALLLAKFFNKPHLYLLGWCVSLIVSFISGNFFEQIFARFTNDARSFYLLVDVNNTAYHIGFRWDFILYSLFGVIIGWYYLFKIKLKSSFYSFIYSAYLIANSFWILVIRSNFSDRFAYLSWFLYPIILIYPLLVVPIWKKQNLRVATIIFINALFTYSLFLRE